MNPFKLFEVAMIVVASLLFLLIPEKLRYSAASILFPSNMWARALLCSNACLMTTLAANANRSYGTGGHLNHHPMIAADILYGDAAVGLVAASGHARPLVGGDEFAGFATRKADNSAGAAADINVEVRKKGVVELSVSGAVITDVNQPVYATDDDTFVFNPVVASFICFF